MAVDWPKFVQLVQSNQRFILTSHIRPDCDALGSELGLAEVLRSLGKDVTIVNGEKTPPNLGFIDPANQLYTIHVDKTPQDIDNHDLLVILDTSAWAQLGAMGDAIKESSIKKIILDHHVSQDDLGAEPFKDTTAEATGSLVVQAAKALQVTLTPAMAMPLFAAIATDTGWFRFGSTTGETYRVAGELLDAGADTTEIYGSLYERDTVGRVRLRGLILSRLEVENNGRFVHTYVSADDFSATGAIPSDTEDAINLALTVEGTEFAVIVIEQLTGGCKISFRSRCELDCSQVASQFDGGGHKAAAGAFIKKPLDEARATVLDHVRAAVG